MAKIYVLDSVEQWHEVRDLRNAAAHDYSDSEEVKAVHFHRLIQNTDYLFDTVDKLERFIEAAYHKKP